VIKDLLSDAAPRPAVEAIIGRCVGAIPLGQIARRHAGAQHLENRILDLTGVNARSFAALRHQQLKQRPHFVRQIESHDSPSDESLMTFLIFQLSI
jgi:hypothetical protein